MKHELVTSADAWHRVVRWACDQPAVSLDTETTGLDPWAGDRIVGISVGVPGQAYYVPVRHEKPEGGYRAENVSNAVEIAAPLLESEHTRKVLHNAPFDERFLRVEGGNLVNYDCTQIMAAIQDERRLSYLYGKALGRPLKGQNNTFLGLDALGDELLGWGKGEAEEHLAAWCKEHGPDLLGLTSHKAAGFRRAKGTWKTAIRWAPLDLVAAYACMDADLPLRVEAALRRRGLPRVYDQTERPLMPVVARMEAEAKHLDLDYLKTLGKRCRAWEEAATACCAEYGIENPKSNPEVAAKLFARPDQGGLFLPVQAWTKGSVKKKREGEGSLAPSSDQTVLNLLRERHPLPGFLLEQRKAARIRTHYAAKFPKVSVDGLFRPGFKQANTGTGRFAGTHGIQQMPRGPVVRRAVVPPEGCFLGLLDYAQIEPRLMAHFGQEHRLISAFVAGEDVYSHMAVLGMFPEVRGFDPKRIKAEFPKLRNVAKVGVLATFYGAKGKKLVIILLNQADVLITEAEATRVGQRIWRAFPNVGAYVKGVTRQGRIDGEVLNAFGRRRHVDAKTGGAKTGDVFNTLIQGTAADVLKNAMLRVDRLLSGTNTRMCLTVHDELGFHVPYEEADILWEIKHEMERDWPFRVPMKAEVSVARTAWSDKKEVKDADELAAALAD